MIHKELTYEVMQFVATAVARRHWHVMVMCGSWCHVGVCILDMCTGVGTYPPKRLLWS